MKYRYNNGNTLVLGGNNEKEIFRDGNAGANAGIRDDDYWVW
jgi:hypothetical protein